MKSLYYTFKIVWSDPDQEYVGLCSEFPSLSWMEKDREAALKGIVSLVEQAITDMEKNGEAIPEPIPSLKI